MKRFQIAGKSLSPTLTRISEKAFTFKDFHILNGPRGSRPAESVPVENSDNVYWARNLPRPVLSYIHAVMH